MLEGGELVHTYGTLSEEICHFFNGGLKRGRREDGFGWNIMLGQREDGAGVCMLKRVCMQLLNAHMLKKEKKKTTLASFSYAQKAKLCKLSPPLHVYFPLEY